MYLSGDITLVALMAGFNRRLRTALNYWCIWWSGPAYIVNCSFVLYLLHLYHNGKIWINLTLIYKGYNYHNIWKMTALIPIIRQVMGYIYTLKHWVRATYSLPYKEWQNLIWYNITYSLLFVKAISPFWILQTLHSNHILFINFS